MYAVGSSSEDFQKYMEAEYVKWGKVLKETGITAK
jgi:tripartite-type tricarboxylate transporter receptor subunit TctC